MELKSFKVSGQEGNDGAALVFAVDTEAARVLAWEDSSFLDEIEESKEALEVVEISVDHLRYLCDGSPCVVDSPPVCDHCDHWGGSPEDFGRCSVCKGVDDLDVWAKSY